MSKIIAAVFSLLFGLVSAAFAAETPTNAETFTYMEQWEEGRSMVRSISYNNSYFLVEAPEKTTSKQVFNCIKALNFGTEKKGVILIEENDGHQTATIAILFSTTTAVKPTARCD